MRHRPSIVPALLVLLALIALPPALQGQAVFTSQYYECVVGQEAEADEIAQEVLVPMMNGFVEAGSVTTWGWLAHDVGGKWRRALFYASPDIGTLFETRDAMVAQVGADHAEAGERLNTVCPTHDDYIWAAPPAADGDAVAAAAAQDRPPVAISQYITCDITREARADEIMAEALGPVYDRFVESGAIASWGWFIHQVGGEYRRLWTISGDDYPSLMDAWGEMIAAVAEEESSAGMEFNQICNGHVDYLWRTVAAM